MARMVVTAMVMAMVMVIKTVEMVMVIPLPPAKSTNGGTPASKTTADATSKDTRAILITGRFRILGVQAMETKVSSASPSKKEMVSVV